MSGNGAAVEVVDQGKSAPPNMPPVAVEVAAPPPSKNPAIVGKLTREEMLEIENLSLKTQNLALQEQRLQQDLIRANQMRQEMQVKLDAMHKALSTRYGIDIMAPTTQITEDGTLIDRTKLPPPQAPKPAKA